MEKSFAELLEEFCDEYGDCSYHGSYSGRCMYGRECPAITTEDSYASIPEIIANLCDYIRDLDYDNASEIIGSIRTDNLGLGMIIYFPSHNMDD